MGRMMNAVRRSIVNSALHKMSIFDAPIASFNENAFAPFASLLANITPVQDTHGFDPFPAGTSKNLLDESAFTDGHYIAADGTITSSNDSMYSALIPVTAGESYTWSGKTAGTSNNKRLHGYLDGVWVEQIFYESISSETFSRTVTIPSGVNGIRVSESMTDYDIMIELGSTATSYIPYSNICPFSGWTGCTIYDDPAYGGGIEWNQIAKHDADAWGLIRSSLSFTNTDTIFTATSSSSIKIARLPVPIGHKILVKGILKTTSTYTVSVGMYDPTQNNAYSDRYTLSVPSTDTPFAYIMESENDYNTVGIAFSTIASYGSHADFGNFQIFDLTQMFGAGNEPTTVAEFDALFYKDYYAYDSGSATCVSAVNGDPYQSVSVTWQNEAGTVYGGTLDVLTGVLTVDTETVVITSADAVERAYGYKRVGAYGRYQTGRCYCNALKRFTGTASQITDNSYNVMNSSGRNQAQAIFRINGMPDSSDPETRLAQINSELQKLSDAGTPLTITYHISSPVTYQLTASQIRAVLGRNHLWATSGNVSVEYWKH